MALHVAPHFLASVIAGLREHTRALHIFKQRAQPVLRPADSVTAKGILDILVLGLSRNHRRHRSLHVCGVKRGLPLQEQ